MAEGMFGPWRSSSYSLNEGNCVEIAWRKSSYSMNESNCVELAVGPTRVGVRDSKNRDSGKLEVGTAAFRDFLAAIRG